jgi:hypothetical protein
MKCLGDCQQGRKPCPTKDACAGDPDVWPWVLWLILAPLVVVFMVWSLGQLWKVFA